MNAQTTNVESSIWIFIDNILFVSYLNQLDLVISGLVKLW